MQQPTHLPDALDAALLLADGTVFYGFAFGGDPKESDGPGFGEVCFNTGMTGYQEVVTDLSYAGQIITFTFPHIGNVGANPEDIESERPAARGIVVREPVRPASNYRAHDHFDNWLKEYGIPGISGVDTRAITRHIRTHGAQNAAILHRQKGAQFDFGGALARLAVLPPLNGLELAAEVAGKHQHAWKTRRWHHEHGYIEAGDEGPHVVAIDYGEKLNILRSLVDHGCRVTVVPGRTSAREILGLKPDGIFLSNGPGDPMATANAYAMPVLKDLIASSLPIFGICLGHQLLALALGARTEKMHQGHRGANHPVKQIASGRVEITSQNHGFVVSYQGLPDDLEVTHRSLFDGTIEGLRHKTKPIFCVQYHPESSPGPHDSRYLFDEFVSMLQKGNARSVA